VEIVDVEHRFSLFLPNTFKPRNAHAIDLTVHFHGAPWFAISEHLRRGLSQPLVVASLGDGSSVYRKPFEDRERFARLLSLVEGEIRKRGGPKDCRVRSVAISSFSAGYGAVRELVKDVRYVRLIRRIVLADSLYGSFETGDDGKPTGDPAKEHIEPWLPFCRLAAQGKKTFVLTYSQVPTSGYASSSQCAESLAEALRTRLEAVRPNTLDATMVPDFPLLNRADAGGFHLWGYGGSDAQAHMTHARHIADIWLALDAAEEEKARAPRTRLLDDVRWD
jgi:hypothetical protein